MIEFEMKVLSIHPAHDYKGERLICVEFGLENPNVQARNSMQTQVQQQTPLQIPLSNRLIIFLTIPEWNSLHHKYSNEEMLSCQIQDNGHITVQPLPRNLKEMVVEKIVETKHLAEKVEKILSKDENERDLKDKKKKLKKKSD